MTQPCPRCGSLEPGGSTLGLCTRCQEADATDADVTSLFSPCESGRVLQDLTETLGGVMPRVLLHEATDSEFEPPLVRPSSGEMPLDAGRSSRIQLLGEIARGGMGAVLKGRDPDLGRDLAVKVLLEAHRDNPDLVRRFVEEAQIGGQLQHPGVVPVYELGTFGDSRPFFTMKLVKGRTLADLMAARDGPLDDFARFIGIFEQIAQTVAYAHARGVIHRDLKPSNVMVGSFGEVQVMDWGLAKVLTRGGTSDDARAGKVVEQATVIATARSISDEVDLSRAGSIMGTPSYMAPEQARGEVARLDERADVFALGSILCEILTGSPAILGRSGGEIQRKAALGDTAEALARLDACGADLDLIGLARHCLAREPEDRPANAGVLAGRITQYQEDVQKKLHDSERDRAVAEATAIEERKRRKLQFGLAASILAIAALGGLGYAFQARQAQARASSRARVLSEASTLVKLAQAEPEDPAGWQAALVSVRQAEGAIGNADPDAIREFERLRVVIQAGIETAERDRVLLGRLVDIRSAKADDLTGTATEAAYASAFRHAGIDLAATLDDETARKIRARSTTVALAIASALDHWASVRRNLLRDEAGERVLVSAARKLDPDPWRDNLRAALDQSNLDVRKEALRKLAQSAGFDEIGPISLELLGAALYQSGDLASSESVLRAAHRRYPGDVWVCYDLAQVLDGLGRPDEALRYFMAARSIRPETAHELGHALEKKGERDEAIAVFRDLSRLQPKNGRHLGCLGRLLQESGLEEEAFLRLDEAIVALREAIQHDPTDIVSRANLGRFLMFQGKLGDAEVVFLETIKLRPDYVWVRRLLASSLMEQERNEEALVEARETVRLEPKEADCYIQLGNALQFLGRLEEAVAAFREAIRLRPNFGAAYCNLGNALYLQGKTDEALAAEREAIRVQPDTPNQYTILGTILAARGEIKEAVEAYLTALRLKPDYPAAHERLCDALRRMTDSEGSIAAYREAMRPMPNFNYFHHVLAILLADRGKFDEAFGEWREAIRLKPDFVDGHLVYGSALCFRGQHDQAEVELRKALQLKPGVALAYFHLGHIAHARRRYDEAFASYREAIRIDPASAEFHQSLGATLEAQGKRDEAIAAYREAIRLRPEFADAHASLASLLVAANRPDEAINASLEALRIKPDLESALLCLMAVAPKRSRADEAIAAFREAVRVKPAGARLQYALGCLLDESGKVDEAIAAYRETIRLDPDYAEAHCNLGSSLGKQGDFDGSLAEYRRGHELGSKRPDWPYPSADWVRNAQALAEQAARLSATLAGKGKPKDANEGVSFALVCYSRGLFAAAARLLDAAFAEEPKLGDDLNLANRYNAACSAALAGCGKDRGDPAPDEPTRARFRRQALEWLRADLAGWTRSLESGPAEIRAQIIPALGHWQGDPDFEGIRDPKALEKLPEAEGLDWRKLWDEVEALRRKAEMTRP